MLNRSGWAAKLAAGLIAAALIGAPVAVAQEVTVFAAASLKNALDDINAAWTGGRRQGGDDLLCGELGARQADRGRRAGRRLHLRRPRLDGLSVRQEPDEEGHRGAAARQPHRAGRAGRFEPRRPRSRPDFDLAGLLGDGRLAMANVDAVPAGKYGKAALETLGVWASVEDKVAQAENVRAALALVSTGEAPLGIVYQTDAAAEPAVKIVGTFPGGHASADHLSGGGDGGGDQRRRGGVPGVPAVGRRPRTFRGAGLHGAGAGRSRTERTRVAWSGWASVRTNGMRSGSPSRSRPGRWSSACRSAS